MKLKDIIRFCYIYLVVPTSFIAPVNFHLPVLGNSLSLLRFLSVIFFLAYLYLAFKKHIGFPRPTLLNLLFMLTLFSQIWSAALSEFPLISLKAVTYTISGTILYFVGQTILEPKDTRKILIIYITTMTFTAVLKSIWFLNSTLFIRLLETIFHPNSHLFMLYDLNRGRMPTTDASHLLIYTLLFFALNHKNRLAFAARPLLFIVFLFITISSSRTYFVTTALGITVYLLPAFLFKRKKIYSHSAHILFFLPAVFIVGIFLSNQFFNQSIITRLSNTFTNDINKLSGRIQWANTSIWLGRQKPWFGTGQNTYGFLTPQNPDNWDSAYVRFAYSKLQSTQGVRPTGHNYLVNLAELGLIGLTSQTALWLYLLGFDTIQLRRLKNRSFALYLAFALPATVLFPLINILDTTTAYEILTWFMLRTLLAVSFRRQLANGENINYNSIIQPGDIHRANNLKSSYPKGSQFGNNCC